MNKLTQQVAGFTLIELLLGLAIIGIVMGVAVPSMKTLITNNRLTTQANSMVGALYLARTESIKQRLSVTVRQSGSGWAGGWQVFIDFNADGTLNVGTDQVIQTYEAISENTIKTNFTNFISYRFDGRSNVAGSFYFCSDATLKAFRRVVIAPSGRIRTETQDTSSKTYAGQC